MVGSACPLCGTPSTPGELAEAAWLAPEVVGQIAARHPHWTRADGACPACVQQALLQTLLERGDEALHDGIQAAWPLDAEAAFGALPTPLRLHADPRYSGRGVTIAFVDSGFHPHPDLVMPHSRIRAWVDASRDPVDDRRFGAGEVPRWPGWAEGASHQWHGLMTSVVAAGNGWLSRGLYRGLANESEVVLIQARDAAGRITNESIARALQWVLAHGPALGIRVVSLSVAGDPVAPLAGNPIDAAVDALVERGVIVVAAAGNDGQRRLVPPATAPSAITVGGLDDMNTFDHHAVALWHSNYGQSASGTAKPELVAPSIWVVAPVLPGTEVGAEAQLLFACRAAGDLSVEARIAALKLVTPHYQHVDGTSFAAPLVASALACALEANPSLRPRLVRDALIASAHPVSGAQRERQGAGALDAGRAVALAVRERHPGLPARGLGPEVSSSGVTFAMHDHYARHVQVLGSWDGWRPPGLVAVLIEPGLWQASGPALAPGRYEYKFFLDGRRWLDDPGNPRKTPDGLGGLNSILIVPEAPSRG
jgi:serine protease AprX